jgi:hypothetical protein
MCSKGFQNRVCSASLAWEMFDTDLSRPTRVTRGGVKPRFSPARILAVSSSNQRGTSPIWAIQLR